MSLLHPSRQICYGLPPALPIHPLRWNPCTTPPGGAVVVSVRHLPHRLRDGHAFAAFGRGCGRDIAPNVSARSTTAPALFSSYRSARSPRPCLVFRFGLRQRVGIGAPCFFIPDRSGGSVPAPIPFLTYRSARCPRSLCCIPHLRPQVAGMDGAPCFFVSEKPSLDSAHRIVFRGTARRSTASVRAAGRAIPCRGVPLFRTFYFRFARMTIYSLKIVLRTVVTPIFKYLVL